MVTVRANGLFILHTLNRYLFHIRHYDIAFPFFALEWMFHQLMLFVEVFLFQAKSGQKGGSKDSIPEL
jgi:hypothetical protein